MPEMRRNGYRDTLQTLGHIASLIDDLYPKSANNREQIKSLQRALNLNFVDLVKYINRAIADSSDEAWFSRDSLSTEALK